MRKSGNPYYWTSETEQAVLDYKATDDLEARAKIWTEKLAKPFAKLVENIFNTFKYDYNDLGPSERQKDCVCHLGVSIDKFNPSKGRAGSKHKAFSFFGTVAKNWMIYQNEVEYKRRNIHVSIDDMLREDSTDLSHDVEARLSFTPEEPLHDFIDGLADHLETRIPLMFVNNSTQTRERYRTAARTFIEIMRDDEFVATHKKNMTANVKQRSGVHINTADVARIRRALASEYEAYKAKLFNE